MLIEKSPRVRDHRHLRRVAARPCCICGGQSQAHHLLRTGEHGMGRRSGDDKTIPLCPTHHQQLHASGDESGWLGRHGINGLELARTIWEARG